MESNVLEFDSSRSLLHGAVLRAVGFPVSLWRVEGELGARVELDGLVAQPSLAVVSRRQGLYLVELVAGGCRPIARHERLEAQLNAGVVYTTMPSAEPRPTISTRWAFDDGSNFELCYQPVDLFQALASARRWMRSAQVLRATTQTVARALALTSDGRAAPCSHDSFAKERLDSFIHRDRRQ